MLSTVSPIALVTATLAVWRVTHLLWSEDGPWDLFVRVRRLVGDGFFGRLLDCFYCLSLWVALGPGWLLGHTWVERILLWLALSAGAILLERMSAERSQSEKSTLQPDMENSASQPLPNPPSVIWHEEPLSADQRKG